jgi:hypothetical protein
MFDLIKPAIIIFIRLFFIYLDKLLIIKAKYYVIEPYYMEGTTPDGPVM